MNTSAAFPSVETLLDALPQGASSDLKSKIASNLQALLQGLSNWKPLEPHLPASAPKESDLINHFLTHWRTLPEIASTGAFQEFKAHLIGKESPLNGLTKAMREVSSELKKEVGQGLSAIRTPLMAILEALGHFFEQEAMLQRLSQSLTDPTLPSTTPTGGYHPVTQMMRLVGNLFSQQGFLWVGGKEIDSPRYNFDALNMPSNHPARDPKDTFYFDVESLLRPHTSNIQVRMIEQGLKPPFGFVGMGRVYRRDSDLTHCPMFHQIEGLVVGPNIAFPQLRYTLDGLLKKLFGNELQTRYRPSFFPFTEPSAEVDISCLFCQQKGCAVCKGSGWIEVLGSGLVHPHVFENAGLNPETTQGFAFGIGVERLLMLYHGISDMRALFVNHPTFLAGFQKSRPFHS